MVHRSIRPSTAAMWFAWFVAPAATPLALMAMLAVIGIVLPAASVAVGFAACYLVAGLLGMPIAFFLRRWNALNGFTIHAAALCWGILSTIAWTMHSIRVAAAIGGTWDTMPLVAARYSVVIVPPVVLAGTAFWLLLRIMSSERTESRSGDGRSLTSETRDHQALNCCTQIPVF